MKVNKKNTLWIALAIILGLIVIWVAIRAVHHFNVIDRAEDIPQAVISEDGNYSTISRLNGEEQTIRNNYRVAMSLDTKAHTYTAHVSIDAYNNSQDDWTSLCLRDYPSVFAGEVGGGITTISNVVDGDGQNLNWSRDNQDVTVVTINLNNTLAPGKTTTIALDYTAKVPELQARYGYQSWAGGEDFYLGNALPILCPYEDGTFKHGPYFAVGECFYSQMANYTVDVTVPQDYTVIATGESEESKTDEGTKTIHYSAPAVRDFLLVIGNGYKKASIKVQGITINSYYHLGETGKGWKTLLMAADTMVKTNNRLGKYPYGQFSVVEAQMTMQGMEYPQMILYSSIDENGVGAIHHEMMHQWFYNLVGSDSYNSAWLDESIATYLVNPGLVGYEGIITKPYNEYEDDGAYVEAMYFCGASMYNQLEEAYGRRTMDDMMRNYLANYAYKEVTTQEMTDLLVTYFGVDEPILQQYIDASYLEKAH